MAANNEFYARSFGAYADGLHDDTAAVQALIDRSVSAPCKVIFDRGVFLCGTLYLRSGITLEILPEAQLKAKPDISAYPDDTHFDRHLGEHHMDRCFIFAEDCRDITICGGGEINGSAASFRRNGDDYAPRPMMLRFLRCGNIRLENIKLRESAAWNTAFLDSENISISDVSVRSVTNLNGDGFDFDGSHNIRIKNCVLNCSDDAICFQAGERPTYDAYVEGCRISSLCCGVRVGMKSMSDIYNINVTGCVFDEVWREGLKIESTEGGDIHDITLQNCLMNDVRRPFWYLLNNMRVSLGNDKIRPFGNIHDVKVKDVKITCTDKMEQTQSYFYGGKDCPMGFIGYDGSRIDAPDKKKLHNIAFENIEYTAYGGFNGEFPAEYPRAEYPRVLDLSEGETGPSSSNYWPDWSRAVFFDIRNAENLTMKNINYHIIKPDVRPNNIVNNLKAETE